MKNIKLQYIVPTILIFAVIFAVFYFIKTPLNLDFLRKKPQGIEQEIKQELTTAEELKLQEQVGDIIKTKDLGQCDGIENEMYKKVCINNIALNLAQETQDISYCQKLDNELVPIRDCESRVVFAKSLEREDIAVCQETKDQELQKQCQDSFYSQLALKKEDINICSQAPSEEQANLCYNSFLITRDFTKDSKNFNCTLLKGLDTQEDCQKMKELLAKEPIELAGIPGMPRMANFKSCSQLKTTVFSSYCLSNFMAR